MRMQAAETGNSSALVDMLAHDAVFVTDGGGKARAAINPIEGSERIAAFFIGNARKGTMGDSFLPVDVSALSLSRTASRPWSWYSVGTWKSAFRTFLLF
ncbi:hypothetical protein PghCCS26_18890 [Paenibacillus glycanilyticus]|uniref:Uncharacterized protein n=2 Tax=Paenibacillus glycanilyticus TaxID=126569 RepID=A0ABQ6NI18_9BACL|nr:hypothetical protein PghCCS26_18890 [Paenibacillus glycanilyticus]